MALHTHDPSVDLAPSSPRRWTARLAQVRPRTLWMLACVSPVLLAGCLALVSRGWQVDFSVYRAGGEHVLGSGLYSSILTAGSHHLPFTYPPFAALLFWPFSFLSTQAGKLVWDAIDLAALTGLIAVSIAAARGRRLVRTDWRTALILVFPVGMLLYPVTNDLELGQINLVLVLMIVADLVVGVSWRGKRLPQGLLTGLAAALKLTPLVFAPYLLVTRQWRAAKNMIVTFIGATALMFVLAPRASWLYFTKDVYDVKRVGSVLITGNQNLEGAMLRAHLSPPHALMDLITVAVASGGIALAAVAYRRSSAFLAVLVCAATGLLISPISWNHHYVWVVPVLVWLVAGVDRPSKGVQWAAAAVLVFLAAPPAARDTNLIWYLRENAYVLATLVFFGLVGTMLWLRIHSDAASSGATSSQGPWVNREGSPRPRELSLRSNE